MTNGELQEIRSRIGSMTKAELQKSLTEVISEYTETNNAITERAKADSAEQKNVANLKSRYESLMKDYVSLQESFAVIANQLQLNQGMLFGTSSETMAGLQRTVVNAVRRYLDKQAASGPKQSEAAADGNADTSDNDPTPDTVLSSLSEMPSNPIDEDAAPDPDTPEETELPEESTPSAPADQTSSGSSNTGKSSSSAADTASGKEKKPHGRRTPGFTEWLDNLQHQCHFFHNEERYNEMFGKGKWHFSDWIPCSHLEILPMRLYVDTTFYPVITPNDLSKEKYYDKPGNQPEGPGKLKLRSWASASLLSYLIDTKFENSVALYAMEKYFRNRENRLSSSWMSDWINDVSHLYFNPVVKYMQKYLVKQGYSQSDETPWVVTENSHGSGTKNYYWVHTSSELSTDPHAIIFNFELGRATEHLRRFYGPDYSGVIEDDAFSAYYTYEKEREGAVTIANCYMHLRRRFVKAFMVLDKKGLTIEQLGETIEEKAISLIGQIYQAENPLKELSPEERRKGRQDKVKPKVEELFKLLHEVDVKNPAYSSYLVDAVNYALNHEDHFKVFLSDPMVPIDNGYAERNLRIVSRGRASFMFSTSNYGAEANAACYSLIKTAEANKAIPDIYLNYLLEEMPKRVDHKGNLRQLTAAISEDMSDAEKEAVWDRNWAFLDKMMPWSEEYKAYQTSYLEKQRSFVWHDKVQMPHVHKGEIVFTEISEEEAEKYDRKRQKRIEQRNQQKNQEAMSNDDLETTVTA